MTKQVQGTNALAILAFAVAGVAGGLIIQFARSAMGQSPLSPPYSLPATMVVLGAVLIALAVTLRRRVRRTSVTPVNPFQAVRLLAAARASQFVGGLIGGFGAGLLLALSGRSVPTSVGIWLPMLVTLLAGVALLVCGVIAERFCRVPPGGSDETGGAGDPDGTSDPADQPA